LTGAPLTSDLSKLVEWLDCDGWDAMVHAWEKAGEPIALRLGELAHEFTDVELRGWMDIGPNDEMTDALRLRYVRKRIKAALESDCDSLSPTVNPYHLERTDGRTAILGCTAELYGQGGWEVTCHGVFPTVEQFYRRLKKLGFWLEGDLATLDDAQLLTMWRHAEATGP
jgi:hypothetical protein